MIALLSISLKFNNEKLMVQPFAWAHSLLRLADGDTLNLLLNSWTILAVAVDKEDVGIRFIFRLAYHATIAAELIEKHLTAFGLLISRYSSVFSPATIISNHCLLTVRVKIFLSQSATASFKYLSITFVNLSIFFMIFFLTFVFLLKFVENIEERTRVIGCGFCDRLFLRQLTCIILSVFE